MQYPYWLNAAISNEYVCTMLAQVIDPEPQGVRTWERATKLYPAGTTFQPAADRFSEPVASAASSSRLVTVPVTERGRDLVIEFISDGPYPNLNQAGLDDATIKQYQKFVKAECGDRAVYQQRASQFINAIGCVIP
jgi:hypothetical protein